MKDNVYLQIANGKKNALPSSFDLKKWRIGYNHIFNQYKTNIESFLENPCWNNYSFIGDSLVRMNTMKSFLEHFPQFLGGYEEETIEKEKLNKAKKEGTLYKETVPIIIKFLEKEITNKHNNNKTRKKAKEEWLFWKGETIGSKQLMLYQNYYQKEDHYLFHMDKLDNLEWFPQLKNKIESNSPNQENDGYTLNALDWDTMTILFIQDDPNIRKKMWRKIQKASPKNKNIKQVLRERQKIARKNQFNHWMDIFDRYSQGLKFNTIANTIENNLQNVAPFYNKLKTTLKNNINDSALNSNTPWNELYFLNKKEEKFNNILPLNGNEFPLDRVVHYIIPDLFAMGGWKVKGKPKKIGRGTRCLFQYQLTQQNKKALFYFAPYPNIFQKNGSIYKAYAAIFREKKSQAFSSKKEPEQPIFLVSQNMDMENHCLTDILELEYLAHEIGHTLHYLSFKGNTFQEMDKMPYNIGEFPSLLFQRLASQPEVLRRWCHGKTNDSVKRIDYWKRRTRENNLTLLGYKEELEKSWIDIKEHHKDGQKKSIHKSINQLRKKSLLEPLSITDKQFSRSFDFTEMAGVYSTYLVGNALSYFITNKYRYLENEEEQIKKSMQDLLNNFLPYTSSNNLSKIWKKNYSASLKEAFEEGMEIISQKEVIKARKIIQELQKKTTNKAINSTKHKQNKPKI